MVPQLQERLSVLFTNVSSVPKTVPAKEFPNKYAESVHGISFFIYKAWWEGRCLDSMDPPNVSQAEFTYITTDCKPLARAQLLVTQTRAQAQKSRFPAGPGQERLQSNRHQKTK